MAVSTDTSAVRTSPFITTMPATSGQQRFAIGVVVVSVLLFAAAVPFAKQPLGQVSAFIPAYQSALVVSDLVTAALLFAHLLHVRSRAVLALAAGYVFTALMAVVHSLTFPGLFAPTGLIGAGPQSTAWLYMFWHTGFPACVIAYVLLKGEFAGRAAGIAGAAATLAVTALFGWLAVSGTGLLPAIMIGNQYTMAQPVVTTAVWVVSVVALVMVWRRKPRAVLDLWLAVVMCAWIFDVALSAVLNAGRFDLGFYAGRIYGLVASTLVLVVLIVEDARLHRGLRRMNAELEHARAEAQSAERAKGSFLAMMSHEIRTPLNGIIGTLELISMGRLEGEQRTQLGIVRTSAQSLTRIIDDILDFSRIEAGKLLLAPEPTNVGRVVERVCEMYAGNASSKGITLKSDVDPAIAPSLRVDALRLQQILANFTSNAVKFTEQGSVKVGVTRVERRESIERLRFQVEDTGIGVSPDQQARLFEPFAQASEGTSARYGGSGLGLSICARLARLMGGTVEMTSELGKGTRMSLELDLPVALEAATNSVAEAPTSQVLVGRRPAPTIAQAERERTLLLLADDHPTNRLVLLRQVNVLGYAAEAVEDGTQALDAWRSGRFAAIITDCHMPEMSGYELARRVRELEAAQGRVRVPIIACTANALAGEAEKCFGSGMDDYLAKPIRLVDLAQRLDRWVPIVILGPLAVRPLQARASSGAPVDEARLAENTLGDAQLAREALRTFRRDIGGDCERLDAALSKSAAEDAAEAAHRIKGSGRIIGAVRLADICERIEAHLLQGDLAAARSQMDPLREESASVATYIADRGSTVTR